MRWRLPPALALAALSPAIAELLTGSTSTDTLFLAPWAFVLQFTALMLFYGGGCLLIREVAVVWGKGWPSILALGAAYGIVEEGLAVHTFFQSGGPPVNALAGFGRVDGVNLVWATGLTTFHAVYSIALPILIVGLAYPGTAGQRFLTRRSALLVATGFVGVVTLFGIVTPSAPSLPLLIAALGVIALLLGLAYGLPAHFPRPSRRWLPAHRVGLTLAGAVPFGLWLLCGLSGPALFGNPWWAIAAFAVGNGLGLAYLLVASRADRPERTHRWLVHGALGALFLWDVVVFFAGDPAVLPVVAVFVVGLWVLGRNLDRASLLRSSAGAGEPSASVSQ